LRETEFWNGENVGAIGALQFIQRLVGDIGLASGKNGIYNYYRQCQQFEPEFSSVRGSLSIFPQSPKMLSAPFNERLKALFSFARMILLLVSGLAHIHDFPHAVSLALK
jgi:hypothetical protein